MKRMRKVAAPLAATAALIGLLTGCSSPEEPTAEPSPTTTTQAAVELTDQSLGAAVQRMVFSGFAARDVDTTCYANAAKDAGLSKDGQQFMVELNSNDWSTVVTKMRSDLPETGDAAADVLSSAKFQNLVNGCADEAAGNAPVSPEVVESTLAKDSQEASKKPESKPDKSEKDKGSNAKPKYVIRDNEMIDTAQKLEPGLVSMLQSFAQTEEVETLLQENSTCMAEAAVTSGLSQESLRTLAGGAPLGTGSIVDQLASDADKKIWESEELSSQFSGCMVN